MSKPRKNPRNDEDQHSCFDKAFEYLLILWIFFLQESQDKVTDVHAQSSNILGEEIFKIGGSSLLHEVVSSTVAEKYQKYGSNVVKSLDISQFLMLCEETVQDVEDISLPLLPSL